jgi:hypothetical protein
LHPAAARATAKRYHHSDPTEADPVNTGLLAADINVPTFLACAFQDEQTGGRCARIADKFASAPVHKFTFYNGAHADGFAPQILVEWKAFLDFYVAGELTPINPLIEQFAPELLNEIFGVRIGFPEQRWLEAGDFETAKAAFEAEDDVRIIFESGAGAAPGAPVGRYEVRYPEWPIAEATPTSWYFQPDGSLSTEEPPADGGASEFVHDAELGSKVTLLDSSDNAAFKALPPYDWAQDKVGDATVFVSEPLPEQQTMVGTGNADLWIQATAPDVDLGVTLSEVRPDGKETYVQSGFLRAGRRKLAAGSTELDPQQTHYEMDAAPLPEGEWSEAQIEIFPFAHVFRPGSRIRISVHTPGGDRPHWAWILQEYPTPPTIAVAHDAEHPSRVILPVVEDPPGVPSTYPPCPGLRGEPCRSFVPYVNRPFAAS